MQILKNNFVPSISEESLKNQNLQARVVRVKKDWRCFITDKEIPKGSQALVLDLDQGINRNNATLYFYDKDALDVFISSFERYATFISDGISSKSIDYYEEVLNFCERLNSHFRALLDLEPESISTEINADPNNLIVTNLWKRIWNVERVMRERTLAVQNHFGLDNRSGALNAPAADWFFDDKKPEVVKFIPRALCFELHVSHHGLSSPDAMGLFSGPTCAKFNYKAVQSGIYKMGIYSSSFFHSNDGLPLVFETSELSTDPVRLRLHEFKHLIDHALNGWSTEFSAHLFSDNMKSYWDRDQSKSEFFEPDGHRKNSGLQDPVSRAGMDFLLDMEGYTPGAKSLFYSLCPSFVACLSTGKFWELEQRQRGK